MNILFHIIQYVFYSIVCKESDLREGVHMQKYLVSIIMPTYNRRQITAVNMHKVNLDGQHLTSYPMLDDEEFYEQN